MSYTFFYDESNNIRKLSLINGCFNTDSHANPSPCFILAGILHEGLSASSDIGELVVNLRLPETVKELKFKQMAKGCFLDNLKSEKLSIILKWLLESDYFIHYSNINMEYWSFVDVIDDYCMYAHELIGMPFDRAFLDFHKNALYELMKENRSDFLHLLSSVNYPRIEPKDVQVFHIGLNELLNKQLSIVSKNDRNIGDAILRSMYSLSDLLYTCSDIKKYPIVYEKKPNILIDGLSFFYGHRVKNFSDSSHFLDNETEVKKFFKKSEFFNLSDINYQFVDSCDYFEVQVSDVLSGLLKNYFTFINNLKIDDVYEVKNSLSGLQRNCLQLIADLISKSDEKNQEFLFCVMSMSEHEKHKKFMFE